MNIKISAKSYENTTLWHKYCIYKWEMALKLHAIEVFV